MRTERIGDATLYTGDVMAVLREMEDESVYCVVTSPPYWGLRDYGTGTWEGGELGCDHVEPRGTILGKASETFHGSNTQAAHEQQYKSICGKCGARRTDQQIGLESSPEEYIARMVAVFREVRRVLRKDGTLWLNIGDSYAGSGKGPSESLNKNNPHAHQAALAMGARIGSRHGDEGHTSGVTPPAGYKPKDLVGIPWMLAFALRADGWYLRSDIIWHKPNPMPESVTDRPTKAHEYLFLLSKSARYFYDAEAIADHSARAGEIPGGSIKTAILQPSMRAVAMKPVAEMRNKRTVWTIATEPYPEAHFATFPRKLVQPCILAGCPEHACPKCGAPWEKEVEHGEPVSTDGTKADYRSPKMDAAMGDPKNKGRSDGWTPNHVRPSIILGEHPTCTCGLPAIGGTVLDPFGGSGTTAEVALEYGRRAILIELKPEYVELQKRRLAPVAGRPMLDFAGAPHV